MLRFNNKDSKDYYMVDISSEGNHYFIQNGTQTVVSMKHILEHCTSSELDAWRKLAEEDHKRIIT